jgi:hypothetical protein
MITIGNDKLMSETEVLKNLAQYAIANGWTDFDVMNCRYETELSVISACINSEKDVVRGFVKAAIKNGRKD